MITFKLCEKKLQKINQRRTRFNAKVERFGTKTNYHGFPTQTILFKDIVELKSNVEVTDHIWFTVGKTIEKLCLQPGDLVEFDARVGEYIKGYVNHREYIDNSELDYKLNRPSKFVKLQENAENNSTN